MTGGRNLVSLLPHRPPMLLLERAEWAGERTLVAYQTIPCEDPVLAGHFPGFPLWPGALLLEAMAQGTAVYLLASRAALDDDEVPVLGAVDCRFLGPVFPGETIEYRIELIRRVGDNGLFSVTATRDSRPVARARISAGINRRSALGAATEAAAR